MENDKTKGLFTQDISPSRIYSEVRCMGCMETFSDEFELCPRCGYVTGTPTRLKCYLQPGLRLLDRYIIGRVIGQGGFGITYIGYDTQEERKVAIKEFFPNALSTREAGCTDIICVSKKAEEYFLNGVKKMLDEGERLSVFIGNPNIVNVFDYFEENGTAYIIMEYLEGKSLKEYLAENGGKIAPDEAVQLILPVIDALEEMHNNNMIHRDIAPDNIYKCNDGTLKLLDFGSARIAVEDAEKSLSVLVKPGYAPKEQYASRSKQGPWTDVYSVCATLYRMMTGQAPVESIERDVTPLRSFEECGIKGCSILEDIIIKGLEPEPDKRIRSADELADRLVTALNYLHFSLRISTEKEDEEPQKESEQTAEPYENIVTQEEPDSDGDSFSKYDALELISFIFLIIFWITMFHLRIFIFPALLSLAVMDFAVYKDYKSRKSENFSAAGIIFINAIALAITLIAFYIRF